MARSKSWLTIQLEYYPLVGLFWSLQHLPFPLSVRLSETILRIIYLFIPKRRRLVDKNLALCFPEMSEERRREVARQSLNHLARGIALLPRFPQLVKTGIGEWVQIVNGQYLLDALKQGKGALAFTAHYGLWEAIAVGMPPLLGIPGSIVERPMDNPRLGEWMVNVRKSGGAKVFPRRQILREGLRLMRQNEFLGMLIDQNLPHGGVFVNFFGRPAATTTFTSLMARRTGCAVIPLHSQWVNGKIQIILEPPLKLSQNPDGTAAVREDVQAMTKVIEGWIRADPTQWLWLHNRWKRQPEIEI